MVKNNDFYAVKEEKANGIQFTFDDCENIIHDYPNAEYIKLNSPEEAADYILHESDTNHIDFVVVVYISTIYTPDKSGFGYGVVMIADNQKYCFKLQNIDGINVRQQSVADELMGIIRLFQLCKDNNYHNILIYHDYEKVEEFIIGE